MSLQITPGIRLSLIMVGQPDGRVEVLCTAEAGEGTKHRSHLLARNVVADTPTAVRVCLDFLDARLPVAAPRPDPHQPHPDDDF